MWNFSQHQQLTHLHWLQPCCWPAPRVQQSNFLSRLFSSRFFFFLSCSLETGQSNRNQSGDRHHGRAREPNMEGELPSNTSQMAARDIHPAEEIDEKENTNRLAGRGEIRETEVKVTEEICWNRKQNQRLDFRSF